MIGADFALQSLEAGVALATKSDASTKEDRSSLNSDGGALEPSKGSAFYIKDVPLGDEGGCKPL